MNAPQAPAKPIAEVEDLPADEVTHAHKIKVKPTGGGPQKALEALLGPDFRGHGDGKNLLDLLGIGRPAGMSESKLTMLWTRILRHFGPFRGRLRKINAESIKDGKINVGYFYNAKGVVGEI